MTSLVYACQGATSNSVQLDLRNACIWIKVVDLLLLLAINDLLVVLLPTCFFENFQTLITTERIQFTLAINLILIELESDILTHTSRLVIAPGHGANISIWSTLVGTESWPSISLS